jgi:pilus assembly protein CpaF
MPGALVNGAEPTWTSPLREIERAAQDQAKRADIDMSAPDADQAMRAIVVEEVGRWRADYRRGLRDRDIADPDGAVERALRNLTGYGPLQPLLEDPDVWEVCAAAIWTGR